MNIEKPEGKIWFLSSCVELYKDEKGISGKDAYNYLKKTDALRFIIDCWEGLHTTSPSYILDSIEEFIENNNAIGRGRLIDVTPERSGYPGRA